MAEPNKPQSPTGQRIEGNWKIFRGKLQEKWGDLRGDELDRMEGKKDQLVGHLQARTGRERAEIEREVDDLSRSTQYSW